MTSTAKVRQWRRQNMSRYAAQGRKGNRKKAGWLPGEHERAEAALPSVKWCACCFRDDPQHAHGWMADHDHAIGVFRAHVCYPCNTLIGLVERCGTAPNQQVRRYLSRWAHRSITQ